MFDVPRPRDVIARVVDAAFAAAGRLDVVDRGLRHGVALTFDDGPSPHNTPRVLDLLNWHDARATFFVVGREIRGREAILERIVAEGHELGNHTFGHPHTSALRRPAVRDELVRANDAVAAVVGVRPRLVRPPFGKDRRRISQLAAELGMTTVLWSVDSRDTRGDDATQVARNIVGGAEPGAIVLLHDGAGERPETLGGLATALAELEQDIRIVTVTELLRPTPPA